MSKRLYMQGYKQKTPRKQQQPFNHELRHKIKKAIMNGIAARVEYEMLNGEGSYERDHTKQEVS